MIDNLTEQNFSLFAAQSYNNPSCMDVLEFQEDLNRIKYLKRLFKRYDEKGDLKERLVINHLIVIYNVFEREAATRMLVMKLDGYLHYLKPFLVMMGYWPRTIDGIKGINIDGDGVPIDSKIAETLRRI
jgi:hypothetical protein